MVIKVPIQETQNLPCLAAKTTRELRQAKQAYFRELNLKEPKEFWRAVKHLQTKGILQCFNMQSTPLEEDTYNRSSLGNNPEDLYCTEEKYVSSSATRTHQNLVGQMVSLRKC